MGDRIDKFIRIMRPLISGPLLGRQCTDFNALLDEATNNEDVKQDIVGNFPKQEKPTASKFN